MARFRFPSVISDTTASTASSQTIQDIKTQSRSQAQNIRPGPSTISEDREDSKPKRKAKGKDKHFGRPRSHAPSLTKDQVAARMARRERIRQKVQHSQVFVGNLSSTTSQASLFEYFSGCGPIKHISLRCSRGVATPTTAETATIYYASIEFGLPQCERAALELHGSVLNGRRLVVCINALDLPEATQICQKNHVARLERAGLRLTPRALRAEPTLILPNVPEVRTSQAETYPWLVASKKLGQSAASAISSPLRAEKKNRILGYSFFRTIL